MITLFDEEEIQRTFIARERREAAAEAAAIAAAKATAIANENGIRSLVAIYKKFNGSLSDAVESVISDYQLPEQEARALVEKYW